MSLTPLAGVWPLGSEQRAAGGEEWLVPGLPVELASFLATHPVPCFSDH